MIAEILRLLRKAGLEVDGDELKVHLAGGRSQIVHVAEHHDGARFWSVVASRNAAERIPEGLMQLLRQNRLTELVGFSTDSRGRWIAQTALPPGPVTGAELGVHVRALAAAADRCERIVTGKDLY